MREKRDRGRANLHVLGTENRRLKTTPTRTTTTQSHQRSFFLLCCQSERYVFFFLLGAKQGDDDKVAERTSEQANLREFFCHISGEYGGFIKSRLAP